jgi:hypothetical protein
MKNIDKIKGVDKNNIDDVARILMDKAKNPD